MRNAKNIIFLLYIMFVASASAACPTGMVAVEYDAFVPAVSCVCPAGFVAHDVDAVCGAGVATGAININYNGVMYHTVK